MKTKKHDTRNNSLRFHKDGFRVKGISGNSIFTRNNPLKNQTLYFGYFSPPKGGDYVYPKSPPPGDPDPCRALNCTYLSYTAHKCKMETRS
jgi:hypothetical protein